jgi:hypothetical protein
MDVETSEALEGLSNRVDGLGLELRGEMAAQGMSLRGEIATQGAELRAEMVAMRQELSAEIRHVQIQVESLRDDIRIVAEGVATLPVKLDRL